MAFSEKSLVRFAQSPRGGVDGRVTSGNMNSKFVYASDDPFAAIATAGYFNAARGQFAVGDLIEVSAAANKGGIYIVTAAPATGNVTITAAVLA